MRTILLASLLLLTPLAGAQKSSDIRVFTIPERGYKADDAGHQGTESWVFNVVVQSRRFRLVSPVSLTIDLLKGGLIQQSDVLLGPALNTLKQISYTVTKDTPVASVVRAYPVEEAFDVRLQYSRPKQLGIDALRLSMKVNADGKTFTKMLDVPLQNYVQRTKLRFPFVGQGIVMQGPVNDRGHKGYSNQFAIDIIGLTENYAPQTSNDDTNVAYAGWKREVLAPADGTIVYFRNDVPNNAAPGQADEAVYSALHDPVLATAGNCVIIDHGNSEYSVMMHMQPGFDLLKVGDHVKQGQVVGHLGNSGDSFGPHLHFQLQNGPELFKAASLPVTFENVPSPMMRGVYFHTR